MSGRRLRLGFAGTPELAACFLEDLLAWEEAEIVLVYTRPDRPRDRGQRLRPSPVKQLAAARGLTVLQPEQAGQMDLRQLRDLDALLVAAYGLLLPATMLRAPRLGCINVHFSLLPRWRGAAPVAHALLAGDHETGISLIRMEEQWDTGPLLWQERCRIAARDTTGSLEQRLAVLGRRCLRQALLALRDGRLHERPQEHARAVYAPRLGTRQATLCWERPASFLERQVRACRPRPGARVEWEGTKLGIHAAEALPGAARAGGGAPGSVLQVSSRGIEVAAGHGDLLRLLEVQPAGRRTMPAAAFWHGRGRHLGHGGRAAVIGSG